MQHRRIALAAVLTLVAGAAAVLSFGLAGSASDSVESDKPRPPMIILTHLDGEGGEGGE